MNYDLRVVGDYIYLRAKDGMEDIMSYNDALYDVLSYHSMSIRREDGRTRFTLWKNKIQNNWYLYDIALACYLGFVQGRENIIQEMEEYDDFKDSLTVDHADSIKRNNTFPNLSLMTSSFNSQKNGITGWFRPPDYLYTANYNGLRLIKYLRRFTVNGEVYVRPVRYVCKNDDSYIFTLKELYYDSTGINILSIAGLAAEYNEVKANTDCFKRPYDVYRERKSFKSIMRETYSSILAQRAIITEYIQNPDEWIVRE